MTLYRVQTEESDKCIVPNVERKVAVPLVLSVTRMQPAARVPPRGKRPTRETNAKGGVNSGARNTLRGRTDSPIRSICVGHQENRPPELTLPGATSNDRPARSTERNQEVRFTPRRRRENAVTRPRRTARRPLRRCSPRRLTPSFVRPPNSLAPFGARFRTLSSGSHWDTACRRWHRGQP